MCSVYLNSISFSEKSFISSSLFVRGSARWKEKDPLLELCFLSQMQLPTQFNFEHTSSGSKETSWSLGMYLSGLLLWTRRSCLIFSNLSSPWRPLIYFDFGGLKKRMDPEVWGSIDRRRIKDGESDILLTPKSRTGDFLSSSSGRSL